MQEYSIDSQSYEMNQIHEHFKDAEMNYGSDLLNLVLARGYLTKLLANAAIRSFIERQETAINEIDESSRNRPQQFGARQGSCRLIHAANC